MERGLVLYRENYRDAQYSRGVSPCDGARPGDQRDRLHCNYTGYENDCEVVVIAVMIATTKMVVEDAKITNTAIAVVQMASVTKTVIKVVDDMKAFVEIIMLMIATTQTMIENAKITKIAIAVVPMTSVVNTVIEVVDSTKAYTVCPLTAAIIVT